MSAIGAQGGLAPSAVLALSNDGRLTAEERAGLRAAAATLSRMTAARHVRAAPTRTTSDLRTSDLERAAADDAERPPEIWIHDAASANTRQVADPANSNDRSVSSAYKHAQDILRFYKDVLGRKSFDDRNGLIKIVLQCCGSNEPLLGGMWDPVAQIVKLGPAGLSRCFGDFAQSAEYLCHEINHGLTNATTAFAYLDDQESSALNEHASDAFAMMFKHWRAWKNGAATPESADWRFAPDVVMPADSSAPLDCVRNLADPASHSAFNAGARHYAYVQSSPSLQDKRYFNMGIPSRAFYLATRKLGGWSFERAGKIWCETMRQGARPMGETSAPRGRNWTFAQFAAAAVEAARATYDADAADLIAQAWSDVGVVPGEWIS